MLCTYIMHIVRYIFDSQQFVIDITLDIIQLLF